MRYYPKLESELIYLSPINREDAHHYTQWLNDITVTKYLTLSNQNINEEKEKELLLSLSNNSHVYGIILKEYGKLIGNIGFHGINHLHQRAEVGLFIGDKNYWNRGYGTEALKLILDYGFNVLNFHNISLWYMDYNNRGKKCYEKVGFKEIGRLREAFQIAGNRYDMIYMDILSSEFESPILKKLITDDSSERELGKKLELVD